MAAKKKNNGMAGDLNMILIPVSIVVGIVAWFLGNLLYSSLLNVLPRPILIGILFTVLYALLLIVVVIVAVLEHQYQGNMVTFLLALVPGILAVFLISALFQFLYGLDLRPHISDPTSYVFVIDDSGSTSGSDPQQLRYKAVGDVLAGTDASTPYMIYSFSDSATILREMGPAVSGEEPLTGYSNGGTAIRGALETVISDYKNGVWDGGDAPKVVLLTDGIATDVSLFSSINNVLGEYVDEGISVSTVGLGAADDRLMTQIAETTGGVYISVADAGELSNAMTTAAATSSSRDLVSSRHMRKLNLLYGLLRILFITLIGTLMGWLIAFAYGNQDSYFVSTAASAVFSLIGTLIMEIFTGLIHFNDRFVWLILWIFVALTILLKRYVRGIRAADLYQMDNQMYGQDYGAYGQDNYGAYGQDNYYGNNDYGMHR